MMTFNHAHRREMVIVTSTGATRELRRLLGRVNRRPRHRRRRVDPHARTLRRSISSNEPREEISTRTTAARRRLEQHLGRGNLPRAIHEWAAHHVARPLSNHQRTLTISAMVMVIVIVIVASGVAISNWRWAKCGES